MQPQLVDSLKITAIGMSLVFLAILVLWGMMELLVQMTIRRIRAEKGSGEAEARSTEPAESEIQTDHSVQRRAAAAALAVALALESAKSSPANGQPAPKEQISAWQSLMRSGQLNQRSSLFTRKPRGRVR
jgi:Na+-transporting methylmalonyl-CoA/oxaloacetate decarboxylase gamma subunit